MSVVPRSSERVGQRRGVADELEHRRADVGVNRLAERLPGRLELLREDVDLVALALGERGGRALEPVAQGRQVRQLLAPERRPQLARAAEHEAVLLARERGGSSSRSSLTSRITTHHASPSGSAATMAGSTAGGTRARTPLANRSASRPGSRVARPSQSEPGTIRLAISTRPSASTTLSIRLPDQPLEASVRRSATLPSEREQLLRHLRHRLRGRGGARPRREDPLPRHLPGGVEVQVVALAHGGPVVAHALEPQRDPARVHHDVPLDQPAGARRRRPARPRSPLGHERGAARPRARRRAPHRPHRDPLARRGHRPRPTRAAARRLLGPAVPGPQ